jgi:hypothetical protein
MRELARAAAALLVLGVIAIIPGTPRSLAQDTEPKLFELVPADRTYPFVRVCSTSEGICALPLTHPPGEPCQCQKPDGSSVAGICTH